MTAIISTTTAPSPSCSMCAAGLRRFVSNGRHPETDERMQLLYHSKDGALHACEDQTRPEAGTRT
jgi:hypothetical protein